MNWIFFSIVMVIIWYLAIFIFQNVIAIVASSFGIGVKEVSVGYGPILYQAEFRHWKIRFGLLPLGGHTKLFSANDHVDETCGDHVNEFRKLAFERAIPLTQILTTLSGPCAIGILGLVCFAIPIHMSSPKLEVCEPSESVVKPCVVGGLSLSDLPTTWSSQWKLFRETSLELLIRIGTFQKLDGWGGPISFAVTAGNIADRSIAAWISLVGVMVMSIFVWNMFPLPCLLGFQVLASLWHLAIGQKIPEKTHMLLVLAGILVPIGLLLRLVILDHWWLHDAMGFG